MPEKRSISLCSTYILPLLGLNRYNFGESNFVNSYINETGSHVVVELKNIGKQVTDHPRFRFSFKDNGSNYVVFELAPEFLETVQLFIQGKYSQFPENAKNRIRSKSGLKYHVPNPKGGYTSARELLALDKHEELRKELERELSIPGSPVRIDPNAELQDIPDERDFFKLGLSQQLSIVTAD